MTCKAFIEKLSEYLDGELSPQEMAEMASHIEECPDCGKQADGAEELIAELRTLRVSAPPVNYTERMVDAVRKEQTSQNSKTGARRRRLGPGAIAGIAAAALIVMLSVPLIGGLLFRSAISGGTADFARSQNLAITEDSSAYTGERGAGVAPMATSVPQDASIYNEKAMYEDIAYDNTYEGEIPARDMGIIEPVPSPGNNSHGQKIIRSGNISLESRTFDADFQAILDLVAQYGGYIESQSSSGIPYDADPNSYGRWGNITARIPSDTLDGFIGQSKGIGNVTNASVNAEDVTAQYQDTQLQLETLTAQRVRLLELVSKATEVADLIALEQELQSVQYRMDALTGSLKSWDARVDYSAVYLYITEVKSYSAIQPVDPTLGERVQDAFYRSINGMIELGQNIIVGLTMASPYLAILIGLAIIGLAIALVVRLASRRKAA